MRSLIALGMRLAVPADRNAFVRAAMITLGTAFGVIAVLSMLSIPGVAAAQGTRLSGQKPDLIGDGIVDPAAPTPPLMTRYLEDEIDGEILTRLVVASPQPEARRPTWLDDYPGPGEVVVSPRLRELIEDHPASVGTRFPQHVIQVIGDNGLVSPDQLIAVIGVTPEELPADTARAAEGIGLPAADYPGPDPRAIRLLALGAAIFVIVPTIVLVATSARLSARTRQRRLAALRLVGISRRGVAFVSAIESAVLASVGGLVGFGLWNALKGLSEPVGLGRLRWFAVDVAVPVATLAAVIVGLVAVSVAIATLGSAQAISDPLGERRGSPRRPGRRASTLRVIPLLVGAVGLAVALALAVAENWWFMLFGTSNLLVGIGLFTAMPVLAGVLGRRLGDRARHPAVALAGRRLSHEPSAAARINAGILALILIVGFGQTLAVALDWATKPPMEASTRRGPLIFDLANVPPGVDPQTWNSSDTTLLPVVELQSSDGPVRGIVIDCDRLEAISYEIGGTCQPDRAQWLFGDEGHVADIDVGSSMDAAYQAADGSTGAIANLRIPPGQVPASVEPATRWVVITTDDAAPELLNRAFAAVPAIVVTGLPTAERGRLATTYTTVLAAAVIAAAAMILIATVAALIDRTLERRRTSNQLLVLGVSPLVLRQAEATWVAMPLLTGFIASATAAAIAGTAYLRIDDGAQPPFPTTVLLAVTAVGLIGLLATTTAAVLATPTAPRDRLGSDAL